MGRSSNNGKKETVDWVKKNQKIINSILDIGPGRGTYFDLLSPLKKFKWIGVEAWKPYIKKFDLEKRYDVIYNQDIRNFSWNEKFDLVIAGDILEHMTKDEAIIVVKKILEHSKFLIISIPIVHFPQGEKHGNPYEVHVKDDWSDTEVMETWGGYIKEKYIVDNIGVYILESL